MQRSSSRGSRSKATSRGSDYRLSLGLVANVAQRRRRVKPLAAVEDLPAIIHLRRKPVKVALPEPELATLR